MVDINNTGDIFKLLSAGSLGAVTVASINAVFQRKKIGAQANKLGYDAAIAVTEAARELIAPLRSELANERTANAAEVDMERQKVSIVRRELALMMQETKDLRNELRLARAEADQLRQENADYKRQVQELENELSTYRRKS
jgi:chromosome segregation ATPase